MAMADKPNIGRAHLNKQVKLSVAANFLNITNVNTVSQQFDAILVLRCETEGLAELETEDGQKVTSKEIWEPRLSVMNLIKTSKWRMRCKLLKSNELSFKYRIEGTFTEEFELQVFPFDQQALSVVLSSALPTSALLLKASKTRSVVHQENFSNSNVFDLSNEVTMKLGQSNANDSTSGTVRPMLTIQVHIQRKSGYFFWNVVVPMLLINLLSMGAFAVPQDSVADRLSVSLTMVLTAVAFKIQIGGYLPNLSYLTLIDKFILVSFFFISGVAFENMLAHNYISVEMDGNMKIVFIGLCGLLTVVSCGYFVIQWFRPATHIKTRLEALKHRHQSFEQYHD